MEREEFMIVLDDAWEGVSAVQMRSGDGRAIAAAAFGKCRSGKDVKTTLT